MPLICQPTPSPDQSASLLGRLQLTRSALSLLPLLQQMRTRREATTSSLGQMALAWYAPAPSPALRAPVWYIALRVTGVLC